MNVIVAELILRELRANGCRFFVVSPGARNSPLLYALSRLQGIKYVIHPDERGSGFLATGYARGTNEIPVLICTSGTAAANYLPAVVEAYHSHLPLILLTADRPFEQQEVSAPQTIIQNNLYQDFVKWKLDIPPLERKNLLSFVASGIDYACYQARENPSAPVHVNCQFREPLFDEKVDEEKEELNSLERHTLFWTPEIDEKSLTSCQERLRQLMRNSTRAFIYVGCLPPAMEKEGLRKGFIQVGLPVIAEVISGLRGLPGNYSPLSGYSDLLFRSQDVRERLRPDLIIHLGAFPLSRVTFEYFAAAECKFVQITSGAKRVNPFHLPAEQFFVPPERLPKLFRGIGSMESKLEPFFQSAQEQLQQLIIDTLSEEKKLDELQVAFYVSRLIKTGSCLYLANSMPVRDADVAMVGGLRDVIVGVNRGVNGIDGTLASALGFSQALGKALTVILGDLAFLHDLNSLLLLRKHPFPVTIVLLNNNGGRIFDYLSNLPEEESFREMLQAPHEMKFQAIAEQFGIDYYQVNKSREFLEVFSKAQEINRPVLIEAMIDPEYNYRQHLRLWRKSSQLLKLLAFKHL